MDNAIADFVKAVVDGKSSPPIFEDGLMNQRLLDALACRAKSRSLSTI
jgi:predicted dehydrogenase